MNCPSCGTIIDLKEARIRSNSQNSYYWGVILEILSTDLGYTKNEMHEILKQLFLSELKILQTKEKMREIRIPKSTTEISTIEMEDYLSQIRQWASVEMGIWLPQPNEI